MTRSEADQGRRSSPRSAPVSIPKVVGLAEHRSGSVRGILQLHPCGSRLAPRAGPQRRHQARRSRQIGPEMKGTAAIVLAAYCGDAAGRHHGAWNDAGARARDGRGLRGPARSRTIASTSNTTAGDWWWPAGPMSFLAGHAAARAIAVAPMLVQRARARAAAARVSWARRTTGSSAPSRDRLGTLVADRRIGAQGGSSARTSANRPSCKRVGY